MDTDWVTTIGSKTSAPSVTFCWCICFVFFRWKHSSSLVSICQSTTSWRAPPWCCLHRDFWAICERRGASDKDMTPGKRVCMCASRRWITSVAVRPFPGGRLTALAGSASSDHLWMNINDSTLRKTNTSVTARQTLVTHAHTHTSGGYDKWEDRK